MKYRNVRVKNAVMVDSKMDGYSVLRLLEGNHEPAHTYIIFISGSSSSCNVIITTMFG